MDVLRDNSVGKEDFMIHYNINNITGEIILQVDTVMGQLLCRRDLI